MSFSTKLKIMCGLTTMQAHMPVLVERGINMLDDMVVLMKAHNMHIIVESLAWIFPGP